MEAAASVFDGNDALQRLASQLRSSLKAWKPKSQRKRSRRMENAWLLCWLLKDLGWVLLCGPLAWPAALGALVLQAHDVLCQWESAPVCEWVHSLATLAWLSGSSVWMTAQLLFEPDSHKDRFSPWYSGSLFIGNAEHFHWGVVLMQAIEIPAVLGLLFFYSMMFFEVESSRLGTTNPTGDILRQRRAAMDDEPIMPAPSMYVERDNAAQTLVFGVLTPEVYSKIYIVPWILKDLFWAHQLFLPAIICMLLVTVFMADYLWLFKKWKNLAVLLWTTGSAVWISNDLVMHEQEMWPLALVLLLFVMGAGILAAVIVARPQRDDREIGSKEEFNPLL